MRFYFYGSLSPQSRQLPNSRADVRAATAEGRGKPWTKLIRARLVHAPDDTALVAVIDEGRGTEILGTSAMSRHEMLQTAAFRPLPRQSAATTGTGRPCPRRGDLSHKRQLRRVSFDLGRRGVAGPDLTQSGEARSAAYLRESILDPQAAVPEGYVRLTVVPKAGRSALPLIKLEPRKRYQWLETRLESNRTRR